MEQEGAVPVLFTRIIPRNRQSIEWLAREPQISSLPTLITTNLTTCSAWCGGDFAFIVLSPLFLLLSLFSYSAAGDGEGGLNQGL